MPSAFTGSAYCVGRFPLPWPPLEQIRILRLAQPDGTVELWGTPDGTFYVTISPGGSPQFRIAFQRAKFTGGVRGFVAVTWTADTGTLMIETHHLKTEREANGEEVEITLSPDVAPRTPVYFEPRPGVLFSDNEQLLFETVRDINERLQRPTHYSLIRSAGMLRQLFLDGAPLVSQVNRHYKVKIEFELIPFDHDLSLTPETHWTSIDPDDHPPRVIDRYSVQQFLKQRCLIHKGRDFTVLQIIHFFAHVRGGVHSGKAKTDHDKDMIALEDAMRFGGLSTADSAMKGIARVALRGLVPLLTAMCEGRRIA